MLVSIVVAAAIIGTAVGAKTYAPRPPQSTIEPSLSQITASAVVQVTSSPVSNVQGVAFNRIIQIWLENTDYVSASADPSLQNLVGQGILLTNFYALTHPSQPNYSGVVAGDHFGMDNDGFVEIPANISTVVDLLDTKSISWGEYLEGLPYAGFQGFNYSNQKTHANDYVRKHNPLILFDSITNNATRLSLIKNFTSFASDIIGQTLPQWSFVTPNMTNDGHDTNVTFAASWAKNNLMPLLGNPYFTNDTLIVLTFDENESYTGSNKVYTILLGGAIPASLKGTTDSTFYTHYSLISSVSANWGLPSLGRWDCGANVLQLVANKTGYVNSVVDTKGLYFNTSYPGPLADRAYVPVWPAPNTLSQCAGGKGVLDSVLSAWGKSNGTYNYTNVFPYDSASGNNLGAAPVQAAFVTASSSSPTGSPTNTMTGTGSGISASPTSGTVSSLVKPGSIISIGFSVVVTMMLL